MLEGNGPFAESSHFLVRRSVAELQDVEILRAAQQCDGVIFALSYVLHQAFMKDMRLLAVLMGRVRQFTSGLPTWFLLQDANYADSDDETTRIWPEFRINSLANQCEAVGYNVSAWKSNFIAPHVTIRPDGEFRVEQSGQKLNVCHFFQRIA